MAAAALGLDDLVANGTLSIDIARLLRAAIAQRQSFLVMAVPRLAGKSTLMGAMLASLPRHAPLGILGTDGDDIAALQTRCRDGYLVIPEISRAAWAPGYVWDAPVRQGFRGIAAGIALATALHAPGPEEAFDIICRGNRVPDEDAGGLALVVYLRSLGDPNAPSRRVAQSVHEIAGVRGGRPDARLLFRWDERRDRFEAVDRPQRIGAR